MSAAEMREAADWSDLPRDMYVVRAWKPDGLFWCAEVAQVPHALAPEVRYVRAPLPADDAEMVEKVARALLVSEREAYANSPELLDEHFEWWRTGRDNPDSCVHYSSIGIAVRQARAALRAINGGEPQ